MDKIILNTKSRSENDGAGKRPDHYFFPAVKSGIFGFIAFILVLITVKLFSSLIGIENDFKLSTDDVFLSLIGFVLLFLIRMLEAFQLRK